MSSSSTSTCSGCGTPGPVMCNVCNRVEVGQACARRSRETLHERRVAIRRVREATNERAAIVERDAYHALDHGHNAVEQAAAASLQAQRERRARNAWQPPNKCGVCDEVCPNLRPTGNLIEFVCPGCIADTDGHEFCIGCGRWEETDEFDRCGRCQAEPADEESSDEEEPAPEPPTRGREREDEQPTNQKRLRCMSVTTVTVYDLTEECPLCMADDYEGLLGERCQACRGKSCGDCWEKAMATAEDRVGRRVCPFCRK